MLERDTSESSNNSVSWLPHKILSSLKAKVSNVGDRRTTKSGKAVLSLLFIAHTASFNVVAFSNDIKKFGLEKLQPGSVRKVFKRETPKTTIYFYSALKFVMLNLSIVMLNSSRRILNIYTRQQQKSISF